MPKYSVIIPIYNAEKTLRRCVDSLLNQNYSDMELILLNLMVRFWGQSVARDLSPATMISTSSFPGKTMICY